MEDLFDYTYEKYDIINNFKDATSNIINELQKLIELNSIINQETLLLNPQSLFINNDKEEIINLFHYIHEKESNQSDNFNYITTMVFEYIVKLFPQDLIPFFKLSRLSNTSGMHNPIIKAYQKIQNIIRV